MTRQAAQATGDVPRLPILAEHDQVKTVGLLVVAGDRGLAGAFNSNAVRAGVRAANEHAEDGARAVFFASGRRPASSLAFRGQEVAESFTGFTDRPAYADARAIAQRLMSAYVDDEVDQVEIFYNGYVSPLTQVIRRETLLPLQRASVLGDDEEDDSDDEKSDSQPRALVEYEPEPEEILARLVPDYVEISIYRALLESTASEHGARMTAMRNASENAKTLIDDYTLEMNRARQAEITQEIAEVVAGAEGLA
jgi:F-type H+-transporting ATPase subunit gamma